MESKDISIWFFIGVLLIVYGFLIMGQGMWELFAPPAHPTVLAELRPALTETVEGIRSDIIGLAAPKRRSGAGA